MTIRVVLADDPALVRAGLRMVIDHSPDIAVVGEAETGTQAVGLARELSPDVVVMYIGMPGIEATQMITADCSGTHVISLTTFDSDTNLYASLRAGASGFLHRTAPHPPRPHPADLHGTPGGGRGSGRGHRGRGDRQRGRCQRERHGR